jgi:hypothetical protein
VKARRRGSIPDTSRVIHLCIKIIDIKIRAWSSLSQCLIRVLVASFGLGSVLFYRT